MIKIIFAAPLLAACSPDMGIWMLRVNVDVVDDECTSVVEHNIIGGFTQEEELSDEWVEEETQESSDQLAFVEIHEGSGDSCILIWGDTTFPGNCSGGTWTFEWTKENNSTETRTHALGYIFNKVSTSNSMTTINLNVDGDYGTGALSTSSNSDSTWVESDMWAEGVGMQSGQIPYSVFVSVQRIDDEGAPAVVGATNTRANAECSQSDCSLAVVEACAGDEYTIIANRYVFEDGSDYGDYDSTGQASGLVSP
jgi:hypothetical protein